VRRPQLEQPRPRDGGSGGSATSSRCAFSSTYSDRSRVTAVLMDSPRSWATMSARYHGSFGTAVVRRPVPRLFRAVPSTLKIGDSPASAASSALLAEYRSGNSTVSIAVHESRTRAGTLVLPHSGLEEQCHATYSSGSSGIHAVHGVGECLPVSVHRSPFPTSRA